MTAVYSWDFAGRTRGGGPSGTGIVAGGDARITPALRLSRSGTLTAPVIVAFDARGTTCSITGVTDTFRQLKYEFGYGDPSSGTHRVTGLSRNYDYGGPMADHIYTGPLNPIVSVLVTVGHPWVYQSNQGVATPYKTNDFVTNGGNTYKSANDHTATSSFTNDLAAGHWLLEQTGLIQNSLTLPSSLDIQDPDVVYAGTLTVCIAADGDFTGAKPGSTHTPSSAALAPPADGIRHLYKGGNTFSGSINIPGNAGWTDRQIQIGRWGSGRAVISGGFNVSTGGNTTPLNGLALYGIDMGTAQDTNGSCRNNGWAKNITVWDCAFTAMAWSWRNVAVGFYDNDVTGTGITISDNNYNFYFGHGNGSGADTDWVLTGNIANIATYHTLRAFSVSGSMGHNWFKGQCSSSPGGELFKLHANNSSNVSDSTQFVVLRDNWVSDSTNTTMYLASGIMPENIGTTEIIQDVICERQVSKTAIYDYAPGGSRITVRGCTTVASAVTVIDSSNPGNHGYPNNPNMSGYNGPYFEA